MKISTISALVALAFVGCTGSHDNSKSLSFQGLAQVASAPSLTPGANGNCFVTGGNAPITVCHTLGDEGTFYATPAMEVAYNVQVLKLDDSHFETVYHTNSRDSYDRHIVRSGDSIRAGLQTGAFSYLMPPTTNWAIWGSTTDTLSTLYYGIGVPNANATGVSGGGNPMVIVGNRGAGDPYYYMFFLVVSDGAAFQAADWRDYLAEARTLDFNNWDVLSSDPSGNKSWQPFTQSTADWQRRARVLTDTNGNAIMSNYGSTPDGTQGLIGSVSYVNGTYYYFYSDYDAANPGQMQLYVRTTTDVSQGVWSPATQITSAGMPITIMRVQKAKGMDRWSVVYSCYSPVTDGSDICVQYTENLNLTGPGGLSSLSYYTDGYGHSPYYLGIGISQCAGLPSRGQHFMMTDVNGNLETPSSQNSSAGGIVTWVDGCGTGIFGMPVYRAGWDIQGATPSPTAPQPTTPPPPPTQPSAPAAATYAPFRLNAGQSLSANGLSLSMQADGNLVLYQGGTALWAASFSGSLDGSPVSGRSCANCYAQFQDDGNLVLLGDHGPYWALGTSGRNGYVLQVTATSPFLNVIMGSANQAGPQPSAPAASQAYGPFTLSAGQTMSFGGISLTMQTDGNLVAYQGSNAVWAASFTPGIGGQSVMRDCSACQASFQSDGNLVLYSPQGAFWASNTSGNNGAKFLLLPQAPYIEIQNSSGARVFP